jgi:hypothetical protein
LFTTSRIDFVNGFCGRETVRSTRGCGGAVGEAEYPRRFKGVGDLEGDEAQANHVARASLEELLADYEDFSRVRQLAIWAKDSKEAGFVRRLGEKPGAGYR